MHTGHRRAPAEFVRALSWLFSPEATRRDASNLERRHSRAIAISQPVSWPARSGVSIFESCRSSPQLVLISKSSLSSAATGPVAPSRGRHPEALERARPDFESGDWRRLVTFDSQPSGKHEASCACVCSSWLFLQLPPPPPPIDQSNSLKFAHKHRESVRQKEGIPSASRKSASVTRRRRLASAAALHFNPDPLRKSHTGAANQIVSAIKTEPSAR